MDSMSHKPVDDTNGELSPESTPSTGDSNRPDTDQSGVVEQRVDDVPIGVVYDILRNERRRRVLEHLDGHDGEITLSELAEILAAIENNKPQAQITSQERKRLYVGLYQCHLPRMDDAGAIEFNRDRGLVRRTEQTDSFIEHLPTNEPETRSDSWPQYYLGIVGGAIALFLADIAGLLPVAAATQFIFVGVVIAVGVCALFHYAHTDESE